MTVPPVKSWLDNRTDSLCLGCGAPVEQPTLPQGGGRRRKWCSERCRKQTAYARFCVDCGAQLSGSDGHGPNAATRCHPCAARAAGAERHASAKAIVEALWAEGLTARQIAERLGWRGKHPSTQITHLRARGYNLPHRRTPEQIARITAGSGERLARAGAAYRAQTRA